MKTLALAPLGLTAMLALAGCVEDTVSMAPAGAPEGFRTTFDGSVSAAAIDACQRAMQAEIGAPVQAVGSEFSQANSAVFFRVASNGAPWRCLVSNDGRGPEVMFMGSEGAA
jgi:ABC-type glycerol-3-phosphate transport system substrate-binding protein